MDWGIGDILQVARLAWDLYDNCYKVAKEAPDDFRQLVSELGSLQGVLKNLRDDINSDKSYIKRLDADRNESLERFLRACFQTLRKLQKLMVDFKVLGIDEGINFWKRIKWVAKKKTVTELKSQIQAHTIRIQLCMSDIGNVQLARIETRIDQALERQEATTEDDDVPLLDAPLEPCTSSMTRQRSSESEPASGPVRRFTGKTLVDNKSSRPKLVDSGQSSDDSELSTVGPPTPSPRKTSDLSRRRTSSMKSGPQMLLASQLADYDDGSALDEKSSNGLLIQIDEDTVPQSDFTGLDRGRKGESDTYLRSILDSAVEELASVRQKERQSRPLRLPDRQRMPKPDEELKKRFEQSAKTEMEYRKLNTKDWLKIGTWWLLKSQFHSPLEPMGEPSCPQGSISTSYCSTTRHAQAYIDLVKASWILFDVILESDYEIPMQADENRKLFRELADGIEEAFRKYRFSIPDAEDLANPDLRDDIWEHMQADEESFEQDLFDLDNTRWITAHHGSAGREDEKVLIRTFVDAAIGGGGQQVWPKGCPYMLMLSTTEGESEPKVVLVNQSGSLELSRDFTIDDLEELSPPSSPSPGMQHLKAGKELELNFGAMKTQIAFANDQEFKRFTDIPQSYFNAVKRREPRQLASRATETLIFKSPLGVLEQLNVSTLKPTSRKHKFESCDLRVLETTCHEGWRTTRRLVLSSSAAEKRPWCKDIFLPMDRVQMSQELSHEIMIKWSDCCQEYFRSEGNYNKIHSCIYDDTKPNHAYRFIFRDSADATGFKKTILSLSTAPTFTWENGPEQSGAIYEVGDTDPVPKRYKAIMLTSTRLNRTYSQLFYTYRNTDFRYDSILHTITFPQLPYSYYISNHVDLEYAPKEPVYFSECVKKFNQQTFSFPSAAASQAFMTALSNDFRLVFSRRAQYIATKAPSWLRSGASSNKGPAEVQLWRSRGNAVRLASRWGDHVADKWVTTALGGAGAGDRGLKYGNGSNRVLVPDARFARGACIDVANIEAVKPRDKGEVNRVATLTLAFATVRDQEEFLDAALGRAARERSSSEFWESPFELARR